MADDELDTLLAEHRACYRTRAGEDHATSPLDARHDVDAQQQFVLALAAYAPSGLVLELACGTGQWTVKLARHTCAVTAVDSSPEALAICLQRASAPHVSLVEADLFAWQPQQRYDLVFFAAWLSQVPPARFDASWRFVADCLTPDGQVFVVDEVPAGSTVGHSAAGQPAAVVERRLTTDEIHRAVKVHDEPGDPHARLAVMGWDAEVREVGWRYFHATAKRPARQTPFRRPAGPRPLIDPRAGRSGRFHSGSRPAAGWPTGRT